MSESRTPNSRESVVTAALALFGEQGFEATGIRDIAQKAGVTTATLYYHFKTKADMLQHIVEDGMNQLIEGALTVTADVTDPRSAIEQLVIHHVRFDGMNPLLSSVIDTEFRSLTGDRLSLVIDLRDQYDKIWGAVISQGVSEGVFDIEDEHVTRLILTGMCKDVAHWYSPAGRLELDKIAELYSAMALRALTNGS